MAIPDPMEPSSDTGVLKTIHDATIITTRFNVLATEWVTGDKRSRAKKEASLYKQKARPEYAEYFKTSTPVPAC